MSDQTNARPRVLVADPIAAEGVEILRGFAEVDERYGLGAGRPDRRHPGV